MKQPYSIALLHTVRALRHWVLACFVCAMAVAAASPLVQPRAMEFICSTAGMVKLFVHTDGGLAEQGQTAQDCPLCTLHGAPPPVMALVLPQPQPLSHAVQSISAARIAAATAALPPARAPPHTALS